MILSGKKEQNKRKKTQLTLSLLLIASPWVLLFITTTLIAHHSVFHSIPCWSDELAYWHEVLSFSQKGFNFGYYTLNEVQPTCLSFGTHGFGAVSVYALFAKIFGWKAYSMVIANAFFVSFSFLVLTILTKISSRNLLFILFFTLSYIPLVLFSGTSMTELLNFSILILYVAMFQVYFKNNGQKWLVLLLLFCTAISFIRIIYILLFLPLLFIRKNEFKFDSKFLISAAFWIIASGLLFLGNNLFVSPYPDSFLSELFKSAGISEFVRNFAIHFAQNTWNFINPFSENSIQVLQRYFELFICVVCLWKSNLLQTKFKKIGMDYFLAFLILFLFLLVSIAAYDVFDWRDYRVMAPVLFGCILFLILNDKPFIASSSLVSNIAGIVFLFLLPQVSESFNKGRYDQITGNQVLAKIEYTENPVSRFENTVVVQQFNANVVLNIPAGIGITYSDVLSDKLRSKYIYSIKKLNVTTYQLIKANEIGYLYQKQVVK
ncbi:MAG: hypothetical protein PHT07_04050 [Paludibacter sp.]|nr:hypothetical protein [Paludibacter sp.]